MNPLFLKTVLLILLFTSCGQIHASTITLDSSLHLTIPSVQVGSMNYAVELQLVEGSSPVAFELLHESIVETNENHLAIYQNEILTIPEVVFEQDKYSAELQLVTGSFPLLFNLIDSALVCSNCFFDTATNVAGLSFNFNEVTPGFGSTIGIITFNHDGTFVDDATNDSGHFIATGTWNQNNSQLSIHFTSYQYDGENRVEYDGDTLVGQIQNNQGLLTNGHTEMNLMSLNQ
jgi:hypothetical protein